MVAVSSVPPAMLSGILSVRMIPPPDAVIVIVDVPTVAPQVVDTFRTDATFPLDGIADGLNTAETPAGNPEVVKLIGLSKPPTVEALRVRELEEFRDIPMEAKLGAMVKSGGTLTCTEYGMDCLMPAASAEMTRP